MHNGAAGITRKIHQLFAIFQHVGFLHAFLDGGMELATFGGKFILEQHNECVSKETFSPNASLSTNIRTYLILYEH